MVEETQRAPLSFLLYFVAPEFALTLAIALRPPVSIRLVVFCAYAYISLTALQFTTGDPQQDYGTGSSVVGQLFTAIYLLWLTSPLDDFRHERDIVAPANLPFLHRMCWAFSVNHGLRGVGWNYQVSNVPERPKETRWKFVASQLTRTLQFFLLVDLSQSYLHTSPLFALPNAKSITSQGYFFRCINIITYMASPFGLINMQYSLLAAVSVAAGVTHPADWPTLFGSWGDAYTLRRFWGRTWHQLLRRTGSAFGKFFTRILGFAPGTLYSSYTQLYVAFIVAGLMHMGGDAMVGREYLGSSFRFFFSQAVAITAEAAVIAAFRRIGLKESFATHLLGYIWVFVWFSLSLPWYIDWLLLANKGNSEALPVSLIRTIMKLCGFERLQT